MLTYGADPVCAGKKHQHENDMLDKITGSSITEVICWTISEGNIPQPVLPYKERITP